MNKAIAILAAVVVALVVAVLVVPSMLDWNRYRSEIATRISSVTGQSVAFDGPIDFQLLPGPAFAATDVRMGEGAGTVSAERIEATLAFWPLMLGNLDIRSLTVARPVLRLPVSELGLNAIASLFAEREGPGAARIDRLRVEAGTIELLDADDGVLETVTAVNLTLSRTGLYGSYEAKGDVHVRGQPMTLTAQAGSSSAEEIPLSVEARLPASDTRATLYGRVLAEDGLHFLGEAKIGGPDAVALAVFLFPGADREGSEAGSGNARPFDIQATLEGGEESLSLKDMTADVAGVLATGSAELSVLSGGVRADVRARVGRVDLDRVLGTEAAIDPAGLWRLAQAVGESRLSGSLDLAADAVLVRGGIVKNANLIVAASEGALTIEKVGANLPGSADVMVGGEAAVAGGKAQFSITVEAEAGNLRRSLEWAGFPLPDVPAGRLRTGSLSAIVSGDGDSITVSELTLGIDSSTLEAGFAYSLGARTSFGLNGVIDRLDLDGYFPELARPAGLREVILGFFPAGELRSLPSVLAGFDANVQVHVDHLGAGGETARGVVLDALLFDGRLDLREIGVDELRGSRWRLGGRIVDLGNEPGGEVRLNGEIDDMLGGLTGALVPLPDALPRTGVVAVTATATGTLSDIAVQVDAAGKGLSAEMRGSVSGAPELRYAVDLTVVAGTAESQDETAATRFAVSAEGNAGSAVFRELRLEDGSPLLSGRGAVDWTGPRPVVQASLKSGGLDFRSSGDRNDNSNGALARQLYALAAAPADLRKARLELLDTFDADLSVVATSIELPAGTRLDGVDLSAMLSDGVLEIRRLGARYAGGRVEITGRMAVPKDPLVSATIRVEGAETGVLGLSSRSLSVTGGTFDLSLDLEPGNGKISDTVEAPRAQGVLSARNGVLEAGMPPTGGGRFPATLAFDSLEMPFALEGGHVIAGDVAISSGAGPLTGEVDIDLAGREIQGSLRFTAGSLAGSGLNVSGPLRRPVVEERPPPPGR